MGFLFFNRNEFSGFGLGIWAPDEQPSIKLLLPYELSGILCLWRICFFLLAWGIGLGGY